MTDFTGKQGLIVGVANKRSISWAIAQAVARRGARLALTYQGRFEEHVNDLSQGLEQSPLVLPCDVSSDAEIASVLEKVDQEFGGLDFIVHGAAFAPREELEAPFVNTTRDGFRVALDISAYSLIALTRAAMPLFEKRGSGSVVTLSYLGSQRVFPNYNVMGVPKRRSKPPCVIWPRTSAPKGFASMQCRQDRSRRWLLPASKGFQTSCTCIRIGRRCVVTSRRPKSQRRPLSS